MPDRELIVKVVGDTAAYERSMKKAAAQSNAFTATLQKGESQLTKYAKRAAFAAGAAGVGALVIGSKKAVDAASNLNESINAVNVTFGKASKQITDFGKTAAATTGLSARQVNESAVVLGSALQNVGYSAEQAAGKTIELTQRAADMASVFNTDVDQALGAIQAALRGESDPIERFGVGLNEAAVAAKALELGLAETTKEVTAQDKAQARLALIIEQTNRVQGDFAETSDGAANQQRILRAEVENLLAQLGQHMLPVVERVLDQVLEWTRKLEENKELQIEVKDAVEDLVGFTRSFVGWAEKAAEALGGWDDAIKIAFGLFLFKKLADLAKGLEKIIGKPGGGAAGAGAEGVTGASWAFRIALPLAVAAGVGQALKNFKPLQDRLQSFIDKFGEIGGQLPSGTGGITLIDKHGVPIGTAAGGTTGKGVVTATGLLTGQIGTGLQLPTTIKPDHPTSGLAGFPADDIFSKTGTRVRAPENGHITRVQGSATIHGNTYGYGIYFLGAQTGNTYFIKHVQNPAKPGFYRKGAVIAVVSAWSGGDEHVHLGIHAGASPVARGASTGGPSDDPAKTKADTKTFDAIPKALQLALASAELTKPSADDERVLRKIRANLQTQLRSKKLSDDDRLEVLNALKSVNSAIESIEDKHAEKLKEKARKKRDAMLTAFKGVAAAALKEFDKATQAGLGVFDELTPAEKELAAFRQQRANDERNQRRLAALAIEDPYEREQRLRELDLEDQEAALEARAEAEREARDKEKQAYEEKRDEDRTRLEVWLDQQEKALADGRKSWDKFYKDLRAIAVKYGFPVTPVARTPSATPEAARAATSGFLPGVGSAAGGHVLDAGSDVGANYVVVNVAGSVTSERDLVYAVRDGLNRVAAGNDGNGLT